MMTILTHPLQMLLVAMVLAELMRRTVGDSGRTA